MRPSTSFDLRRRLLLALGLAMLLAGVGIGALAGYADRGTRAADVPAAAGPPVVLAALILLLTTGLGFALALRLGRARRPWSVRAPRESSK